MLFGNPHEFAIWADPVWEWSQASTVEGLYVLCIDGTFLLKRSTLSAMVVTVSGESDFWARHLHSIENGEQTRTAGRNKNLLLFSALISRGGLDYLPRSIETQKTQLLDELSRYGIPSFDSYEGIDLTPMETGDYGWAVYLFFDEKSNEDVIVYANFEDPRYNAQELRLPSGRVKEILAQLVTETKVLDQRRGHSPPGLGD